MKPKNNNPKARAEARPPAPPSRATVRSSLSNHISSPPIPSPTSLRPQVENLNDNPTPRDVLLKEQKRRERKKK